MDLTVRGKEREEEWVERTKRNQKENIEEKEEGKKKEEIKM